MSAETPPRRIQLRRTPGWRKPVGAVVVARPSRWGNPFRTGVTPADHRRTLNSRLTVHGAEAPAVAT